MGEFAKVNDKFVKIGTCEEMIYLRLSDLVNQKIEPIHNNVDVHNDFETLWFRLPYPEEKSTKRIADLDIGDFIPIPINIPDEEKHHNNIVLRTNSSRILIPCTRETRFEEYNNAFPYEKLFFFTSLDANYCLKAITIRNSLPTFLITCSACSAHWSWVFEDDDVDILTSMFESIILNSAELPKNIMLEFLVFDISFSFVPNSKPYKLFNKTKNEYSRRI